MLLWIKAFHIISVITWFAGIFYLPRLFVYHAMAEDEVGKERFKVMERKLYRGIMTPSMLIAIGLGIWMAVENWAYYKTAGWFHAKMLLVIFLIGYNHMCGYYLKVFAKDANTRSHTFYRWFNEAPVVLLLGIVILVIVRPF